MIRPAVRRVFVLLGAYEDLTERESGALRRGDIDYAIALENRKLRLARALADAQRGTALSPEENASLRERVTALTEREKENLDFLRHEMDQVRHSLSRLHGVTQRSRQVLRGYGTADAPAVADLLGQA